jgi:predicted nucleic acid-binding protein
MNIVVDTSVIIAVITNESHKKHLVEISKGAELIAPASLYFEVGNAFSAMFKRGRITLEQAYAALFAFNQIQIRYSEVDLSAALKLSHELSIYAYDAYIVACAIENRSPILSLDSGLLGAARRVGVKIVEVPL